MTNSAIHNSVANFIMSLSNSITHKIQQIIDNYIIELTELYK